MTHGGREGARGATLEQLPALDAGRSWPGGENFHFRSGQDGGAWPEARGRLGQDRGGQPSPVDLAGLLRGWGQMKADDSGWLTFDG